MTGCSKFLEVTPRATVSDDKLFQDEAGFVQALNGVYAAMGSRELYGDNISMGYLSAAAKNYNITATSHRLHKATIFNYENASQIKSIWEKSYNAIATLNNILERMEERKVVFSENNYNHIRGEVLAIRAYLHFDLYRMFGKNYQSHPTAKAVPYRTVYDLKTKVPSTAKEVVELALEDLNQAEKLLSADEIVGGKEMNRRYRLNYYAVLGLKARIYNYIHDGANAVKYALQVVDSKKFPFVQKTVLETANEGRKDRVFTSELVFGLRTKDIGKWADGSIDTKAGVYFRYSNSGTLNYTLTQTEGNYSLLFEKAANPGDYRYVYLFEQDKKTTGAGTTKYPSKYWQTWVQASGEISLDRKDQTVPLIRITEMYYILANNASSISEALGYLNTVRENRGITKVLTTNEVAHEGLLRDEITKEYQKEFYAEGQTFFWYKQIGATSIKLYAGTVVPENYVFPIPEGELEFNQNYD